MFDFQKKLHFYDIKNKSLIKHVGSFIYSVIIVLYIANIKYVQIESFIEVQKNIIDVI